MCDCLLSVMLWGLNLVLAHLQVVSLLLPLRYDLVYLGGSWAQRQVLSVTLIQAAINSKQFSLALALVAELKVHIQ